MIDCLALSQHVMYCTIVHINVKLHCEVYILVPQFFQCPEDKVYQAIRVELNVRKSPISV